MSAALRAHLQTLQRGFARPCATIADAQLLMDQAHSFAALANEMEPTPLAAVQAAALLR